MLMSGGTQDPRYRYRCARLTQKQPWEHQDLSSIRYSTQKTSDTNYLLTYKAPKGITVEVGRWRNHDGMTW